MVFKFFAFLLLRKILFKVLLAPITPTNSRDFKGSRIRISPTPPNKTGSNSKRIVNLHSLSEKADSYKIVRLIFCKVIP